MAGNPSGSGGGDAPINDRTGWENIPELVLVEVLKCLPHHKTTMVRQVNRHWNEVYLDFLERHERYRVLLHTSESFRDPDLRTIYESGIWKGAVFDRFNPTNLGIDAQMTEFFHGLRIVKFVDLPSFSWSYFVEALSVCVQLQSLTLKRVRFVHSGIRFWSENTRQEYLNRLANLSEISLKMPLRGSYFNGVEWNREVFLHILEEIGQRSTRLTKLKVNPTHGQRHIDLPTVQLLPDLAPEVRERLYLTRLLTVISNNQGGLETLVVRNEDEVITPTLYYETLLPSIVEQCANLRLQRFEFPHPIFDEFDDDQEESLQVFRNVIGFCEQTLTKVNLVFNIFNFTGFDENLAAFPRQITQLKICCFIDQTYILRILNHLPNLQVLDMMPCNDMRFYYPPIFSAPLSVTNPETPLFQQLRSLSYVSRSAGLDLVSFMFPHLTELILLPFTTLSRRPRLDSSCLVSHLDMHHLFQNLIHLKRLKLAVVQQFRDPGLNVDLLGPVDIRTMTAWGTVNPWLATTTATRYRDSEAARHQRRSITVLSALEDLTIRGPCEITDVGLASFRFPKLRFLELPRSPEITRNGLDELVLFHTCLEEFVCPLNPNFDIVYLNQLVTSMPFLKQWRNRNSRLERLEELRLQDEAWARVQFGNDANGNILNTVLQVAAVAAVVGAAVALVNLSTAAFAVLGVLNIIRLLPF